VRILKSRARGGYGLDAQWNDDFHHALHTVLTGETDGYYTDFGRIDQLSKALTHKFVYDGIYSDFRKRRHGNCARDLPPEKFIIFSQNHDQVGNRMHGERLSELVSKDAAKLAAAMVLLSPYIPLLFMGEEYAETSPFKYFISHSDPDLISAVREGRQKEFASFKWKGEPEDPQSQAAFDRTKLSKTSCLKHKTHSDMLAFYQKLIRVRKKIFSKTPGMSEPDASEPDKLKPDSSKPDTSNMNVTQLSARPVLCIRYHMRKTDYFMIFHLSGNRSTIDIDLPAGSWQKLLETGESPEQNQLERIPDQIVSAGKMKLALNAFACLVFERNQEDVS